jgi:hypothetical protein
MEFIHHVEEEHVHAGGSLVAVGWDRFKPFSNHPMATRKYVPEAANKIEFQLSPRQIELRQLADKDDYSFNPQRVKSIMKYKDFPIQKGNRILFEENVLTKYLDHERIEVSDMTLTSGAMQDKEDIHITVIHVSELEGYVPDFALEPEGLLSKFSELTEGKDIDFSEFPMFSKKYYLRSNNEAATRGFFSGAIVRFLENREEMHIECHKSKLLIYKKRSLMTAPEIDYAVKFAEDLVAFIQPAVAQEA